VSGLSQPTAIAFIGIGDILVLQKADGRVRRVINGVIQPGQVLDVAVDSNNERGLLGIAVDPNFPTTPFVYIYYTESSTGSDTNGSPAPLANRVYRYSWNGSALIGPTPSTPILDLPVTPGPNHNGGTMAFGPDGKLYVVIGDLNHSGKLQNNAAGSDPDNTGVIFRINDDGSAAAGNPFSSFGGNLAKYYAYGVRNGFGLAFDPITGKLWDTENGPSAYDEINLIEAGFNSGWNRIMGPVSRDAEGTADLVSFDGSNHYADPKFSWFDTVGPTGIAFLNSARLGTEYQGDAFVGDINNGFLYRFRMNATRDGFIFTNPLLNDLVADNNTTELQEVILGTGFVNVSGGISDIKVGPDGLLYVVSFGFGKIFVISGAAPTADFDGDAKSDIAVYRSETWFIQRSSDNGQTLVGWGAASDVPVLMDNDGDGKIDQAVFRNGAWFILKSTGGSQVVGWGTAGDVPVPADYDGDGKTDVAVFRNGAWFILKSTGGSQVVGWGTAGDVLVPADYDGDGKTDVAVFRNGAWFILRSMGGNQLVGWGMAGDVPVPADYDGDGKADVAVFRNGAWFILRSTGGNQVVGWGTAGDVPVPADYDGDGKADVAVFRNGAWFILKSTGGSQVVGWGTAGDVPLN
jgi:glucose/arabinose dehydrogenase